METFTLKIMSPQGLLYEGKAEEVIVPAVEGAMGILPRHISMISALSDGNLEVKEDQQNKITLPIVKGYLKFEDNQCTIVCEQL